MAVAATTFGGLLEHATRPKQTVILVQVRGMAVTGEQPLRGSALRQKVYSAAREDVLRAQRHSHILRPN